MAQPIVQITDVYKQYGGFKAVDGISLTIDEGDIYGFLGPNGAGKSTTLRMLLSLISPTAGSIEIISKTYGCYQKCIAKLLALKELRK